MSERETKPVIWAVKEGTDGPGKHSEGYAGMDYATKYVRADIAEQEKAELVECLQVIRSQVEEDDFPVTCRWADALLAKHIEDVNLTGHEQLGEPK